MGALILEEIMKDLLRSHDLDKGRQLYLAGSRYTVNNFLNALFDPMIKYDKMSPSYT